MADNLKSPGGYVAVWMWKVVEAWWTYGDVWQEFNEADQALLEQSYLANQLIIINQPTPTQVYRYDLRNMVQRNITDGENKGTRRSIRRVLKPLPAYAPLRFWSSSAAYPALEHHTPPPAVDDVTQ